MNKILVGFLFFISIHSYCQMEIRPNNGPRGVRNIRDEEGNKQGIWRAYNYYGDLMSEIEFKNNRMEGKYVTYFAGGGSKGGKIKESGQYFDGKKDGPYTRNYFSGQIAEEGEYLLNKKNGRWTTYYIDGQVRNEGEYKQNKKDGIWKYYNRKGVEGASIEYKNGVNVLEAEKAKELAEQKKAEMEKIAKNKKANPVKK